MAQLRLHNHSNNIDMLHGPLLGKILIFALPLAASMMLQQLFNSADVAVVGRFDSPQAMAAVGSNGAAINLMVNLFVGLSIGANVVVARCIGRNETGKIHDAIHTSISLALISGVLLLTWGVLIAKPILTLMNTPEDIIDLAVVYFRIYFLGMPFIMLYNFGSAILRSKGDSKRPLWSLGLGGVINVILNLIFVIGLKLSVVGVALATVISNVVSSLMIMYYLMTEDEPFRFRVGDLSFKREHFIQILKIGLPAGIQGSLFSISNMTIQTAINSLGSYASAGSAAALNFDFLTYYVVAAFTQAAVTFTSQNFGAGDYGRCKRVFSLTMSMGVLLTGAVCLACAVWKTEVLSLYTVNPEVLRYAEVRMIHAVAFLWMCNIYEVSGGCLRGMGYSMLPSVLVLLGCCVLRIVWVYTVFAWENDFAVLMNVYPVSWTITGIATMIAYWYVRRKLFA
ncbi:MAG: MATE family efflux transporter [Synergistaceae bacterium]|nr:MATE family efflux transporter [Synergistaceae bacterium]MBQ3346538.1 MATE family efflux transporter [Synergistaceae bacterium]MBQ3398718.1 MATE family efflux transporter [Synergistaceae bacterium]MBQ6981583.1 MATE family efflux transporter [Synergistaceae bacterium]